MATRSRAGTTPGSIWTGASALERFARAVASFGLGAAGPHAPAHVVTHMGLNLTFLEPKYPIGMMEDEPSAAARAAGAAAATAAKPDEPATKPVAKLTASELQSAAKNVLHEPQRDKGGRGRRHIAACSCRPPGPAHAAAIQGHTVQGTSQCQKYLPRAHTREQLTAFSEERTAVGEAQGSNLTPSLSQ